jgi:hypothetical protein
VESFGIWAWKGGVSSTVALRPLGDVAAIIFIAPW